MSAIVSLRQVVDELDGLIEECTAVLNRQTGELYAFRDEEAELAEEGADLEDLADWQSEEIPRIREILESEDWVRLPTRFEIHEWEIMEEFACSITDLDLRDEVLRAVRGSGAFRRFKDAVYRHGIEEEWYAFRRAALERIAVDWLDEQGISYTRDEKATPAE